jgi:hypothetical protein
LATHRQHSYRYTHQRRSRMEADVLANPPVPAFVREVAVWRSRVPQDGRT